METVELNEDSSAVHIRAELERLTRRVPPAYQNWGVVRTREYKKVAKDVTDSLKGGLMKQHLLWAKLKLLRTFW